MQRIIIEILNWDQQSSILKIKLEIELVIMWILHLYSEIITIIYFGDRIAIYVKPLNILRDSVKKGIIPILYINLH